MFDFNQNKDPVDYSRKQLNKTRKLILHKSKIKQQLKYIIICILSINNNFVAGFCGLKMYLFYKQIVKSKLI